MDVVQHSFRAQRTTGTGALVPSDTHGARPDSLQESVFVCLFVCLYVLGIVTEHRACGLGL
jgi:hypothetical protein